jgi:hypothetical protein
MDADTPEIWKCRIDKGLIKKGEAQQITKGTSARAALLLSTPYSFIHSTPEMEEILVPINVRIWNFNSNPDWN